MTSESSPDPSQRPLEDLKGRLPGSALLRLCLLGGLGLLLQVPIAMIQGVIGERQQTRASAVEEVTTTWGQRQTLAGPLLVVPCRERWLDSAGREQVATRQAFSLPEELSVRGVVESERRYRGVFAVPLYRVTLDLSGQFRQPEFQPWPVPDSDILWDGAELVLGLSDLRAIHEQVQLTWNGQALRPEQGRGAAALLRGGIHLPSVPLRGAPASAVHRFSVRLTLGGSKHLHFLPAARDTQAELFSSWRDPSFSGAFLPAARQIGPTGFAARWHVPHLGRNYPQRWRNDEVPEPDLSASAFGVSFLSPGDAYTAVMRAVKYQVLFVMLTFLVFFLFEVFYRLRIHPVQYLLVGAALCLFYLLLALAEHIGFGRAYLAATSPSSQWSLATAGASWCAGASRWWWPGSWARSTACSRTTPCSWARWSSSSS